VDAISPEFRLEATGPGSFIPSESQIDDDHALMMCSAVLFESADMNDAPPFATQALDGRVRPNGGQGSTEGRS
jgi:hypothetical protein